MNKNWQSNTNEYVYKYPEHWNTYKGKKEIGLRSVIVKNASRDLKLKNIYFRSNAPVNVNISFSISLSSNDDMSAANDKFKKAIKDKHPDILKLYPSGVDPIAQEERAKLEGISPKDICDKYHELFLKSFDYSHVKIK